MSNRQLGRNLRLLASTSVVALVLTAAPVSLRVLPNAPARHLDALSQSSATLDAILGKGVVFDADVARRMALARLGLSQTMTYTSPLLLTLSKAWADGGEGEGGEGEGEGGGGGSGGGGESGDDGGTGGVSGPSSSESSEAESADSGGGFGDVEQVGPSLSQDEEAAAIIAGWQ